MLYVGTSGFSYPDWREVFYPQGMKPGDFLSFYSEHFDCVELNFTYYRQPAPHSIKAMASHVPPGFKFTAKAHKTMTHQIPDGPTAAKEFEIFRQGMAPMVDAGKLGCVLFQFPWSFRPTKENTEYVLSLPEKLGYADIVVEFRNSFWAKDEVYASLKKRKMGFCCVDEPELKGLFPKISLVTSTLAYLRFHGRNAAKWFNHKKPWERYDYLYSEDELDEWVPKIQRMAKTSEDTYVFFNNCHQGQAAINARQLQMLLIESQT